MNLYGICIYERFTAFYVTILCVCRTLSSYSFRPFLDLSLNTCAAFGYFRSVLTASFVHTTSRNCSSSNTPIISLLFSHKSNLQEIRHTQCVTANSRKEQGSGQLCGSGYHRVRSSLANPELCKEPCRMRSGPDLCPR
jgi:hypothetical protein